MKILLLNQAFHPDVVSSGQHATDLALELTAAGHEVTVMASRSAYDDAGRKFPAREDWRGVQVVRIGMFGFGKSAKWRRALDFGSFLANCCLRLLMLPRFDAVIAMTSPPLISALGAWFVSIKGGRFVYWVMDLNPDEAIAANWIRPGSPAARGLAAVSRYSLRRADLIVALDRFMAARIESKGIPGSKIRVIPPWSHDGDVAFSAEGRESFRREHGLEGKFVVMYSGNHSPCHPLDTVLRTALRLATRSNIAFCFVGGGSEFRKVREFASTHNLHNVHCIPYQPLDRLSASLSAADLHLVVMGDPFVGIVHPCKVYNIRHLGIPFLYIGPEASHVAELSPAASFRHGAIESVAGYLTTFQQGRSAQSPDIANYARRELTGRMVEAIESVVLPQRREAASEVLNLGN